MMEADEAAAILSALAQPTRLSVFRALVTAGPLGRPAGALALAVDVMPATLSFHLKELAHAGLVEARREGRNIIYAVNSRACARFWNSSRSTAATASRKSAASRCKAFRAESLPSRASAVRDGGSMCDE